MQRKQAVERVSDLMDEYVQNTGQSARVVGGQVDTSYISLEFDNPIKVDTGELTRGTGYGTYQETHTRVTFRKGR